MLATLRGLLAGPEAAMTDTNSYPAEPWADLHTRYRRICEYIEFLMRQAEKLGPTVPPEFLDRIEGAIAAAEQAFLDLNAGRIPGAPDGGQ